jgi:hypothetical protein
MDALKIRTELRRMGRRDLLKLVARQKISNCLLGGTSCRFHLRYKEFTFCSSEIMGDSCQIERLKNLEEACPGSEEINHLFPLLKGLKKEFVSTEKRTPAFRIYYRDEPTGSLVLLGKTIERRRKERRNNLKDLLKKAAMDYSECVKDPSGIFLIGS